VAYVARILPFSREGQWDRDSANLGVGKASAVVAHKGGSTVTRATGYTESTGPPPNTVVLHPSPCKAIDFPSLGSFHSCGSNHPVEQARLPWRAALHFIVAMATRSLI